MVLTLHIVLGRYHSWRHRASGAADRQQVSCPCTIASSLSGQARLLACPPSPWGPSPSRSPPSHPGPRGRRKPSAVSRHAHGIEPPCCRIVLTLHVVLGRHHGCPVPALAPTRSVQAIAMVSGARDPWAGARGRGVASPAWGPFPRHNADRMTYLLSRQDGTRTSSEDPDRQDPLRPDSGHRNLNSHRKAITLAIASERIRVFRVHPRPVLRPGPSSHR
jgi:hypothetical protein